MHTLSPANQLGLLLKISAGVVLPDWVGLTPPEGIRLLGGNPFRGTYEALARRPFSIVKIGPLWQCERHLGNKQHCPNT